MRILRFGFLDCCLSKSLGLSEWTVVAVADVIYRYGRIIDDNRETIGFTGS